MVSLSIIIPCYNVGGVVGACLESILSQVGNDDIEVVAVNDGSTDNTLDVLRDFEQRFPNRLRVIDKKNGGVSSARNIGMERAAGRYLAFVDGDDTIAAEAVRSVSALLSEHDYQWLFLGMRRIYPDGTTQDNCYSDVAEVFSAAEASSRYLLSNFSSPCAKIYKTDIIRRNNLRFDESRKIYEDAIFNMAYLNHVGEIATLPGVFYNYIQYPGTASRRFYGDEIIRTIEDLRRLRTDYFVTAHKMTDMARLIQRDAAFVYLFAIYSVYRSKGVTNKYHWLKRYWNEATQNDPDWTTHLDNRVPKVIAIIGAKSLRVLHIFLSILFTIKK